MSKTPRSPHQAAPYFIINRLISKTMEKIGAMSGADKADLGSISFNRVIARARAAETKMQAEG